MEWEMIIPAILGRNDGVSRAKNYSLSAKAKPNRVAYMAQVILNNESPGTPAHSGGAES